MLLSRKWSKLVGRHVRLHMLYTIILVNGKEVRIDRETKSSYIIEDVNTDQMINFFQYDMENFQVCITNPFPRNTNPIETCGKEDPQMLWWIYFDGCIFFD